MENIEDRLLKLENRITLLEDKYDFEKIKTNTRETLSPKPLTSTTPPPPKTGYTTPKRDYAKVDAPFSFWFKTNWITSLGILMVVLAMGWFIGYAFSEVSVFYRILLGLIISIGVYSWGVTLKKKHEKKGIILILLGEALSITTLYLGHQFYDFLPSTTTFTLMLATTVITTIIAIKNNSETLGLAAVIVSMIIPGLIFGWHLSHISALNYILAISTAAVLLYINYGWTFVFCGAWVCSLFASFLFSSKQVEPFVLYYIPAFYLLFFIPAAFSACSLYFKKLPLNGNLILDISTVALSGWINKFISFEIDILYYLLAAACSYYFCIVISKQWPSLSLDQIKVSKTSSIIFCGSVMSYIYMALTSLHLNYYTHPYFLLICFLVQTVIAMGIAKFIFNAPKATRNLALFFILPLGLIFDKFLQIFYAPIESAAFLSLVLTILSFVLAKGMISYNQLIEVKDFANKSIHRALDILIGLFSMILIWNVCHNFFHSPNTASGVSLVLYIVIAETLIYMGNQKTLTNLRIGGVAIIIFVIFRLFFVEIWQMPTLIRILTFVTTGCLLIATAWLDKRTVKV